MGEEKREAIITASRTLFRKYGVKKTSMQEIAREAKIAVGTVYLYFKSKEEVVAAGVGEYREIHKQQTLAATRGSGAPADRLRTYISQRFRACADTRKAGSYATEIARAVVKVQPDRFAEESQWFFETVKTILEQGLERGEFELEAAEVDTTVFLYSISSFFPYERTEFFPEPDEVTLMASVDWFIRKWTKR